MTLRVLQQLPSLSLSRRFCSVSSTSSLLLSHPATRVTLHASDLTRTDVSIVPVSIPSATAHVQARAWTATGDAVDVERLFQLDVDGASDGHQSLRLVKTRAADVALELVLPRNVALDIVLANGRVAMRDTVEGDVKVVVQQGDIRAHKVRGPTVHFSTNHGMIDIAALVEAETVHFKARDGIQCKRLMAKQATVKLGKGDQSTVCSTFGAIYASSCSISATKRSGGESRLHVGHVHGHLQVNSEGLDSVQVDSVSGTIDVQDHGDKCHVTAHFDSWTNDSCSSIVVAGDVHVSLQPAAPMDVELHGTEITTGKHCAFQSRNMDQLEEDYAVFTASLCAQEEAVVGTASTGKINVDSAKQDALRTSFFMKETGGDDEAHDDSKPSRLFVHSQRGAVTLEQLTWMDNIKRKYVKQ
uniref:DUF4097 domain-containing protein n=1 Tax=Hyaloperonospora arabidopsidis (strain Emoy2) TaxID=559515 RepID=M4B7Q1_HYAAE